jgi:ABC-type transporter Mla subunit MlaD
MREEIKAGIIIVSSLLILSIFVILIGGGSIYEKLDKYYVKVMNVGGLEVGSQVRLGGVRVGRVMEILVPQGPGELVTVEIGIKKGITLYKGTKALITQTGFVGDIYLLLSVSDTSKGVIKPGEIIPSEEQAQFGLIMSKIDVLSSSIDKLVNDVDRLFSEKNVRGIEMLIGNTNDAIVNSSSNLEKVANSLKGTTEKLNDVLTEVEEVVKSNKGEISQVIKKAKDDLEKANDMIRSIESTAKSFENTSKTIDKNVALQSKRLERLLNSMAETSEELRELIQEIKNKPWSLIYKEKRND